MPVTNYIYDPVTEAYLMETDGDGNMTAWYTQEPVKYGDIHAQRRIDPATGVGQSYYYHPDALGSTRELTDANGDVVATYNYDAFGNTIASTGTIENPFRFTGNVGYYWDEDLQTYHIRARNYQPTTGRWTSQDPLLFVDGVNLYEFVRNCPLMFVDPSGTESLGEMIGGLIGAIPVTTIGISKTGHKFFPLPTPPFPPGSRFHLAYTIAGEFKKCCRGQDLHSVAVLSFALEGYATWGFAGKWSKEELPAVNGKKKRGRDQIPDGEGGMARRRDVEGTDKPWEEGYRARHFYLTKDDVSGCPEPWFDWQASVFLRGTIGWYWGTQLNISQPVTKDFDFIKGWNLDGGIARGVYGVSVELGVGGTVYVITPSKLIQKNSPKCGAC